MGAQSSVRWAAGRMRNISLGATVVVTVLCALSVSAAAREDALPPITESAVDEVERYLELRLSEVGRPGLSAAAVHGGEIVFTVELGEARPGVPMTADTPVFIASISKSITAMALMQQVEAGRVDLDDPVARYLPELGPEGDVVTVRDLMHHRSGLTRHVGNEPWSGDLGSSLETNVARLGPFLEADAPYGYSNANYDALALIVERVSGTPFDEFVADEVFDPLQMGDSFVGPEKDRGDVANGHYRWLFLGYRPFDQSVPPGMVGSAVMYSSAEDLAHFLIAHLEGGVYEESRVLSDRLVDRLHRSESLGIDLPEEYPIDDIGYAGGLRTVASFGPDVDEDLARMVTLTHGGSSNGSRAAMWMIPDVDLGFVVLTNGYDLADETWLPQVAQGVKHLLFGLQPTEVENYSPFLRRFAKQLMLALVTVQVALAALTIRALRRPGPRRSRNTLIIAASIVDLTALVVVLWVVPTVGEAPLRVALQLPDIRILIGAMSAGVIWGVYRTFLVVKNRRPPARPAPTSPRTE